MRRSNRYRPSVDGLETRQVLSSVSVVGNSAAFYMDPGSSATALYDAADPTKIDLTVDGQTTVVDASLKLIQVYGMQGDFKFDNDTDTLDFGIVGGSAVDYTGSRRASAVEDVSGMNSFTIGTNGGIGFYKAGSASISVTTGSNGSLRLGIT